MHKSSLLEIIRTFSKAEQIKFADFLKSPYHNKKINVLDLYLQMKSHSPEFTSPELTKENIWTKIFPNRSYNYGIMKNLIFDLTKLAEKFVTLEYYGENKLRVNYDLIESLYVRNIIKLFSVKLDMIEKSLTKKGMAKNEINIEEYFFLLFKIFRFKFIYTFSYNPKAGAEKDLSAYTEYLLCCFLIFCFKEYNNIVYLKRDFNYSKEESKLEVFLKGMDSEKILEKIINGSSHFSQENKRILNCFYEMYRSMEVNDDLVRYDIYKKTLKETSSLFNHSGLRDLYVSLLNSIINLNLPKLEMSKEYFSIIKIMHANSILLTKSGTIEEKFFNIIINQATILKDIEFLEMFIKNYTDKLPDDVKDNMYKYSMANLFFAKCEYSTALEYISQIQHDHFIMKYYIKNLNMMCYYELNDFESFDFAFDSYKHLISQNKESNERMKNDSNNFCNYLKKLFRLKEKFNSLELEFLKKQISETSAYKKIWLLEKINEFDES